jgi:hypothetical protein
MNEDTKTKSEDFVNSLGAAVRDNPLPAALIGMGLVWLLSGDRSFAKAGFSRGANAMTDLNSRAMGVARSAAGAIGDSANSASEFVTDSGGAMVREVGGVGAFASSAIRSRAPERDVFASARTNVADLMQRQPLLLGAIGIAFGAGVAASLRTTATEADLLGDASAKFQERARALAAATTQQASKLAGDVATTVANEARVQGLTADELKQNALDMGRKIQSVAKVAAENAHSRMN